MSKRLFLILTFILLDTAYAQKSINFTPLPMKKATKTIQDFVPMGSYLKQNLGVELNYVYKTNYGDILDSFSEGKIDMAYLGPLPLVSLKQKYPHIKPIITFKQKNGSKKYRCVLSKFKKDKIDSVRSLKVALTQPLSTCGYFMTSRLLKEKFNMNLEDQKYNYTMSHANAMLGALSGEYTIAGAKDTIAKKYESVGMEIIAISEELPGFSLVVNTKTLSDKEIEDIQNTLLGIPKDVYKSWKGIFSKGFIKSDIGDYDVIDVDFTTIPLKGNIK